jgi:ESCRT-I complex subunit VPS28
VRDIQTVLSTFPNLPANFTGVALTKKWVEFFSEKSATYDLNETEMRQLKFDLENVMSQFNEIVLGAR